MDYRTTSKGAHGRAQGHHANTQEQQTGTAQGTHTTIFKELVYPLMFANFNNNTLFISK